MRLLHYAVLVTTTTACRTFVILAEKFISPVVNSL